MAHNPIGVTGRKAAAAGRARGPAGAADPSAEAALGQEGSSKVRLATFSSLHHRDYRYLWGGTLFMSAGQWIQQVTLGWLVYDMTGSSVLLGALGALRSLPFLASGPAAGVVADRWDRRKLLCGTQAILVVTAGVMGTLVLSGRAQVWHLFLFTLITGIGWSFSQPLRQALVPTVVPKEQLVNAVALSSMGFNIMKVIAPTVGGFLIALFGAGGNLMLQGATYAGVFAMIYAMRVDPQPTRAERSSALVDLQDGLKYVLSNPLVLAITLSSLVSQVFAMPYQTLMPVFQKEVLGVGPEGLGMLTAAPAVGAVATTFLLASLAGRTRRMGLILMGGLIMLGAFLIVFSQTKSLPLAMLALVGVGSCQMLFNNLAMTMIQIVVPDTLRGRVLSIYMLDRGLAPVGSLLAGIVASVVGAPATVVMMGLVVILLTVLLILRVPSLRRSGAEL